MKHTSIRNVKTKSKKVYWFCIWTVRTVPYMLIEKGDAGGDQRPAGRCEEAGCAVKLNKNALILNNIRAFFAYKTLKSACKSTENMIVYLSRENDTRKNIYPTLIGVRPHPLVEHAAVNRGVVGSNPTRGA